MKTCDICLEEFQPKSARQKRCSDTCRKAQARLNSLEHYYKDHEVNKGKSREATQKLMAENPVQKMFNGAKSRASERGILFTITVADLDVPKVCPVFGLPFARKTQMAMSIDRIDPTLGYVTGNVQVISKLANLMKNNATPKQLKQFAAWVDRSY